MTAHNLLLGVNIDHVATLRQVRLTHYPDLIAAAAMAEAGGADGITIHLREDRRHIQDRDVWDLQAAISTRLNLEIALTPTMVDIALAVRPHACCVVPEQRHELTTEGGLDVLANAAAITTACQRLQAAGIIVSLFIDPVLAQIDAAQHCGASVIEFHTGDFANAESKLAADHALKRLEIATQHALALGLQVNAGHGLHYTNVQSITAIAGLTELNIGHSIVARALFVGLETAVREMKALMRGIW